MLVLLFILFWGGSHVFLVYAKTHRTCSGCITSFFMDYSIFKSSSPKSLSAKIRSSSEKWPNSFEQLHKTIPSLASTMCFMLRHCRVGMRLLLGWRAEALFTSFIPNGSICAGLRSEQLVFQSKCILLQFDLFWKLDILSNVYVLRPLSI